MLGATGFETVVALLVLFGGSAIILGSALYITWDEW